MFLDWIFYTFFICCSVYLIVMVFYYKTLLKKERAMRDFVKNNLDDTEIIIRKLQVQLQRSLGNIDILTDELNKIKGDVTGLRTRNSQYRIENDNHLCILYGIICVLSILWYFNWFGLIFLVLFILAIFIIKFGQDT